MQIDIKNKKKNSTASDIFTLVAIILIISIPLYGYFKLKPDRIFHREEENIEENDDQEVEDEEEIDRSKYITEHIQIDGQWAYIIAPEYIEEDNPPQLVIYHHGSITFIEENMDENFKADLIKYGKELIKYNYIFAASNAHGVNWGNKSSIIANYNMYEYIKSNYQIKEKINHIGFSMGGLPAMNFTFEYPELVNKVVLLSPTTRRSELSQQKVDSIMDIDIKIWHGTADVNVGFNYTKNYVETLKNFGKEVDFIPLEGIDHWSVDTFYIDDIIEFFNQ